MEAAKNFSKVTTSGQDSRRKRAQLYIQYDNGFLLKRMHLTTAKIQLEICSVTYCEEIIAASASQYKLETNQLVQMHRNKT